METARHRQQMTLLIETIQTWLVARPDGYAGGNMFIHFSLEQVRNQDFRGPDFFLVLGVPKKERKSWVVWEEGKGPDVVIELLSESTAEIDKTEKKRIYQNQLRVLEYFWYDPFEPSDLAGFKLDDGAYKPLPFDNQDRLISPLLGLSLVRWQGVFENVEAIWLRWASLDGKLLPTEHEVAEQIAEEASQQVSEARRLADDAAQFAQQAEQRAAAEAQRAQAAEAEIARLKALLAKGDS
jgi:Uma2 family endonuclease